MNGSTDPSILAIANIANEWYTDEVAWEVIHSEVFERWFQFDLTADQQDALLARILLLAEHGPTLGRPTVDTLAGSAYPNMKELRVAKDGHLRVLFIFDPLRRAVLLVGGDKTGRWAQWYRESIPLADRLYGEHLREEGLQ